MTTITSFEKHHFPTLRAEIDEALKQLGKKHGLVFHAGNVTFSHYNAEFKLSVATLAKDGTAVSKEAESFKLLCKSYGLQPEDLGRRYKKDGQTYTVIGCKPNSYKYPILVSCTDGKRYKVAVDSLIVWLKLYEVK